MTDDGEPDDKVLCVPVRDPQFRDVYAVADLARSVVQEIEEFFRVYKNLEEKEVIIKGVDTREESLALIRAAMDVYSQTYGEHRGG
jgi:inorganic pyrophosphatase